MYLCNFSTLQVNHYTPAPWFVQHLSRGISAFLARYPSHSSRAIITQSESDIGASIVDALLQDLLPNTFVGLKKHFGGGGRNGSMASTTRASGVPLLIELSALTLRLECFVKNKNFSHESVREYLVDQMEAAVGKEYGNIKKLAMEQQRAGGGDGTNNRGRHLSAMILNSILNQMENAAQEYNLYFQRDFYVHGVDIRRLVCSSFYRLFMEDVCRFATGCLATKLDPHEIDLQIVGLMFKLNQVRPFYMYVRSNQILVASTQILAAETLILA